MFSCQSADPVTFQVQRVNPATELVYLLVEKKYLWLKTNYCSRVYFLDPYLIPLSDKRICNLAIDMA